MRLLTRFIPLALLVAALATIGTAQAGSIVVQPTNAIGSGDWDNIFDGSGLSDITIVETGDAVPAAWPTHILGDSGDPPNDPDGLPRIEDSAGRTNGTSATITFDLGGTYGVDAVVVWNYNERWQGSFYHDRGLNSVDVEVSTDGGTTFSPLETLTFAEAPDVTSAPFQYDGELVPFSGGAVTADHIRFIAGNHGGGYTGVGEVRFTAVPVPEPSSLLLLGIASVLGFVTVRRRK